MRTIQNIIDDLAKLGWQYYSLPEPNYKFKKESTYIVVYGNSVACYSLGYECSGDIIYESNIIPYEVYCLIYELINLEVLEYER